MNIKQRFYNARVAELVDALDLGSSPPKRIGVQIPSLAPIRLSSEYNILDKGAYCRE